MPFPSNSLPLPNPEALSHSQRLYEAIALRIEASGWISFADFMQAALYAPGLGYYAAGAQNFGRAGDFVTAPELTPLFAKALARQAAEVMSLSAPCILEAGAGSGRLAADLLLSLEESGNLPERYDILEIAADLQERQFQAIKNEAPHLLSRVFWKHSFPERFSGLILANELLDAMPVYCIRWEGENIFERGVSLDEKGAFCWQNRPASGRILEEARAIAQKYPLLSRAENGFESELPLTGADWVAAWGNSLEKGAVLLVDYGFSEREFYHPDRNGGTLMCHYRHRAHTNPFIFPGLQDITAHVDFTRVAASAFFAGLELLGYASQGSFLVNCGLLRDLEGIGQKSGQGGKTYLKEASAAQKLLQAHEMGELFKVMAVGKGITAGLSGFARNDRGYAL